MQQITEPLTDPIRTEKSPCILLAPANELHVERSSKKSRNDSMQLD